MDKQKASLDRLKMTSVKRKEHQGIITGATNLTSTKCHRGCKLTWHTAASIFQSTVTPYVSWLCASPDQPLRRGKREHAQRTADVTSRNNVKVESAAFTAHKRSCEGNYQLANFKVSKGWMQQQAWQTITCNWNDYCLLPPPDAGTAACGSPCRPPVSPEKKKKKNTGKVNIKLEKIQFYYTNTKKKRMVIPMWHSMERKSAWFSAMCYFAVGLPSSQSLFM